MPFFFVCRSKIRTMIKMTDMFKICTNCNLELRAKRNFGGDGVVAGMAAMSMVCFGCVPESERNKRGLIAFAHMHFSFSISSGRSNASTGDRSDSHRLCRKCRFMMPTELNFGINNRTSAGRVFRKWTCSHCRQKAAAQLRDIKKHIDMNHHYGRPCPICGLIMEYKGPVRAVPDHCHSTGKLRGVICNSCNTAIGALGDRPDLVLRAYSYLINGGASSVKIPVSEPHLSTL